MDVREKTLLLILSIMYLKKKTQQIYCKRAVLADTDEQRGETLIFCSKDKPF